MDLDVREGLGESLELPIAAPAVRCNIQFESVDMQWSMKALQYRSKGLNSDQASLGVNVASEAKDGMIENRGATAMQAAFLSARPQAGTVGNCGEARAEMIENERVLLEECLACYVIKITTATVDVSLLIFSQ